MSEIASPTSSDQVRPTNPWAGRLIFAATMLAIVAAILALPSKRAFHNPLSSSVLLVLIVFASIGLSSLVAAIAIFVGKFRKNMWIAVVPTVLVNLCSALIIYFWPHERTLLEAVAKGNESSARWALRLGVSPNTYTYWGWSNNRFKGETALTLAAKRGNLPMVRVLVEYGGDIHLEDGWKRLPIFAAARSGNRELVLFLVEQGADPKVSYPDEGNLLHQAAFEGKADLLSELVRLGVPLDEKAGKNDRTPLWHAAMTGNADAVRFFLQNGADPLNVLKIAEEGLLHFEVGKESFLRVHSEASYQKRVDDFQKTIKMLRDIP